MTDRNRVTELCRAVFLDEHVSDSVFFQRLELFQREFGLSAPANRIVGRMWSSALSRLVPHERDERLLSFARQEGYGFWFMMGPLQTVLVEQSLDAKVAAAFLTSLAKRVAGVLAAGEYWKAVQVFCESHPSWSQSTHLV